MSYTMVRHGDFYAIPLGSLHCGNIEAGKPHRFTYTVRCESNELDSSGFIVDQLRVHDYFENIGEFSESCELLASRLADRIMDLGSKLTLVNVAVSPAVGVFASYEKKREVSSRKVVNITSGTSQVRSDYQPPAKYADDYFDWHKLPVGVAVGEPTIDADDSGDPNYFPICAACNLPMSAVRTEHIR